MIMFYSNTRLITVAAALMFLSSCQSMSYVDYNSAPEIPDSSLSRSVAYEVTPAFELSPPECVVILPFGKKDISSGRSRSVERALARYLFEKVDRVVGPVERDYVAELQGFDARSSDGVEYLLSHFRCGHVIRSTPVGDNGTYALVWAQAKVGLQVQLEHGRRGTVLWRARHIATRSEGGLPLSPLGVAVNVFWATRFQSNQEEFRTLTDDAARRIVRTFPNIRRKGGIGQAGYHPKIAVISK
jgi:hypothetical protein